MNSFISSFTAWFETSKTKLGNIPKIKAKIAKGKSIIFSLVFKSNSRLSSYLDQYFPKNILCNVQRKYPAPRTKPNTPSPVTHFGKYKLLKPPIKVKNSPIKPENAGNPNEAKNAIAVSAV